jgi:hypothetical protein
MSSVFSSGKRFAVAVGWLLHFHDDDVLLHVKVAMNCMWRWHMLPRWGGPLPFPERLQLASRSSASDCDHMCTVQPIEFRLVFLACYGLGGGDFVCIAVAVFQNTRSIIAICSETLDCSCRSNMAESLHS